MTRKFRSSYRLMTDLFLVYYVLVHCYRFLDGFSPKRNGKARYRTQLPNVFTHPRSRALSRSSPASVLAAGINDQLPSCPVSLVASARERNIKGTDRRLETAGSSLRTFRFGLPSSLDLLRRHGNILLQLLRTLEEDVDSCSQS